MKKHSEKRAKKKGAQAASRAIMQTTSSSIIPITHPLYSICNKFKFKKVNSKIKVAYKQFDIGEGDNVRRQIMGEIEREIKEFRKYFIVKNPGVSFYFSEPVN